MELAQKEKIEIEYWQNSGYESPDKFTVNNFLNKTEECKNLCNKIIKHHKLIKNKKSVLEVGAGQGWASCFMKRFFLPDARFTVTDISPHAVEGIKHWEKILDVKIDKHYAAKSYKLPEEAGTFDLIFCYAAAHHFVLYEETLTELKRVLSDNGRIIFMYEPTCSKWLYPVYYRYVNKVPHVTPEDVIVPSRIRKICTAIGLQYTNKYDPERTHIKSISSGIYFKLLRALPFLQSFLPSSSDLIFKKK